MQLYDVIWKDKFVEKIAVKHGISAEEVEEVLFTTPHIRMAEKEGNTTVGKKKPVNPIPEEFSSYEEAAQFWETHDTTDYPEDFHVVEVNAKLRNRRYEIAVEADVVKVLQARAKRRRVSISYLANDLLRQQLVTTK